MYFRMNQFCGLNQSPFSNGISYADFRKGYFMAVFDLSTSMAAGSGQLLPSVRLGHVRLNIHFNAAVTIGLECLLYSEFLSTLYIHKTGKVTSTYF